MEELTGTVRQNALSEHKLALLAMECPPDADASPVSVVGFFYDGLRTTEPSGNITLLPEIGQHLDIHFL